MTEQPEPITVGILGAGTMGTGIAQVAATHGHPVRVYDTKQGALARAHAEIEQVLYRLSEKGRLSSDEAEAVRARILFGDSLEALGPARLVIEAIVEDAGMKRAAFRRMEQIVARDALLATNTSSLSVTALAGACRRPERFLGLHFFNPAPLMPLVEVVPSWLTDRAAVARAHEIARQWGKLTVQAKDTPGFIVNRVARPFYGEALRMLEEGFADAATIDWAMRETGGFRMGPFELMDLIGNDINFTVSETVFEAFYYDPRFRPSLLQKRMVEAGLLGRKSKRGYYDYRSDADAPKPRKDPDLARQIVDRILVMLINEAADVVFLGVATPADVELAMTKGTNYPRGLLLWANEIGLEQVLSRLERLHTEYGDDRYRPNPLLRRLVRENRRFPLDSS